jgi:hypothetical protein
MEFMLNLNLELARTRNFLRYRLVFQQIYYITIIILVLLYFHEELITDHLCGLVIRVLATDPEIPSSIPSTTRDSEE